MDQTITVFDKDFPLLDGVNEVALVRVLSKIDFNSSEKGCWLWTGYRDPKGYGRIAWQESYKGRRSSKPAHRVVYTMLKGPVEGHLHLHHVCENPSCVNPDHLMPVTPRDHILNHTPTSLPALFHRKDVCMRGHDLLDPENIYTYPKSGVRRCKTCLREWERERYRRENPIKERPYTHCRNGHEMTDANTGSYGSTRFCKTCHNIASAQYYIKKKSIGEEVDPKNPPGPWEHCALGHPMIEGNIYMHKKPGGKVSRQCKTCFNARRKARYYEKTGRGDMAQQITQTLEATANEQDIAKLTVKTHCPYGHPYNEKNTMIGTNPNGGEFRACRECARIRSYAAYLQKKGKPEEARAMRDALEAQRNKPPIDQPQSEA